MILQALYEYEQRKGKDLTEDGFEVKELKFLIKIKEDGTFVSIVDTREEKNKKLVGKSYTLPAHKERTGAKSYETTFLLWDHYGYVLNEHKHESIEEKLKKEISDAAKQNNTFIDMISALPNNVKCDKGVNAVIHFYEKYQKENYKTVKECENWKDCVKIAGCNLSFILEGDDLPVPCRDVIKDYQRKITAEMAGDKGICLITGENAVISRLHSATSIIGSESNAKLVGFQKNSGYDSYGKEQAYNAPVSIRAEAAYTKALNYLIKSPKNRFRLGEDTIVFWAEKQEAEPFESAFSVFFSKDFDSDDPDRCVSEVKNLFNAINTGKLEKIDSDFYVLCLSPNVARISVRFWETGKVEQFAKRIKQHFDDFEIERAPYEAEYLNLYQILSATALEHKMENVAPNLIGTVTQAVLKGLPYPATLQQQCIRRIRAERKVTRERAAILKAYINRFNRYKNIKEDVSVSLDRNCTNKGYLLGRLFAVFEKVQQDTHPGLNATITDRFYGAASTNPVTVFAQLMKLNRHHLNDYPADKIGIKRKMDDEIGSIINSIESFPAHLNLNEQSQFAIGYYHEKQSFFVKSENKEGEN